MNLTKKLLPLTVAALIATPVMAEISGNIGATSNYLWRGATQSNDQAAISGGIDYSHESGFYAGTWISNMSAGDETDLYLGFSGASGDLGYTFGYILYKYNQTAASDFSEIHADISYGMFSAGVAYTVDGDADDNIAAAVEGDVYVYASVGSDLKGGWSLGLTVGSYEFDNDGKDGGPESYVHYQADLTKSLGDMGDFTFTLSQTDLDGDDVNPVVSWAKSF